MRGGPVRLSTVIITLDEARNLPRCLASLEGVADEVVVLDSGSTDATRAIAGAAGARVLTRPFDDFTSQKNAALDAASHDHVLSLDADEWLSPELAASIRGAKADWRADGYAFPRLNHYGDRPIRTCGWYPDRKVRLWDRRRGRWGGGLIHETVRLDPGATTGVLAGDLMHRPYERASQLIRKADAYSEIWARDKMGRRRIGPAGIIAKTAAAFARAYLLKGGWRDGHVGLLVSGSIAAGVFYNNAKLVEANRSIRVSLVVTTYNREDALELVLRSALAQVEPPHEIIVADDGSRDDTRALVERIAAGAPVPVRHAWHEDRGFRAAAIRNEAIALTTGDYLVLVDGDMVLEPHFVADHRRAARKGRWIQGGRVILDEAATRAAMAAGKVEFGPLAPGLRNRKNAIRSALLSALGSRRGEDIYRVRSANMGVWRDDVVRVNGFNEAFEGWGREDSEFAARLHHAGLERLHLRFAALGYHLWHPEASRQAIEQNQRLLEATVATRMVRCERGLDGHLAGGPAQSRT